MKFEIQDFEIAFNFFTNIQVDAQDEASCDNDGHLIIFDGPLLSI